MKIGATALIVGTVFVLADRIHSNTLYVNGWEDVVLGVAMWLGLLWLVTRDRSSKKPKTHEETSEGVAFRLGKALNRVRRRLRGA